MYNFVHSYIPLSVHFYFIINITHIPNVDGIERTS